MSNYSTDDDQMTEPDEDDFTPNAVGAPDNDSDDHNSTRTAKVGAPPESEAHDG